MKRWHDTLVILGSHPTTRLEFDWKRAKDVDVYSFNEAVSRGEWIQFSTAVLQMHVPAIWRNPTNRNDNKHADWLVGGDTPPVLMQEAYEDVPQAEAYPVDDVIAKLLPGFHRPKSLVWNNRGGFFTSSLDFGMAMGIYLEYKRIEIYGCEMAMNTEYLYQRPGFAFWTGLALGRGIEIDYHGSIFDVPLYGYEGDIYLPRTLFEQRKIEQQHYCQEATISYQKAKELVQATIQKLVIKQIEPPAVLETLPNLIRHAQLFGQEDGKLRENDRYLAKIAAMEGKSGEFRISRQEYEGALHGCQERIKDVVKNANLQALNVQAAFKKLVDGDGYKKRIQAAIDFQVALDEQVKLATEMAAYDGAGAENIRYMSLLDEKYRAAGGQKSVEVLENVN